MTKEPRTDTLDSETFVERAREACSVALADLLVLGMPSPETSTGKLLTGVIRDAARVQAGAAAKQRTGLIDTLQGARQARVHLAAALQGARQARGRLAAAPDAAKTPLPPLDDSERRLAGATAHLITKAAEIGLPDTPDKLGVTPLAIQLLARSYIELWNDPGPAIQDRIGQIARVAIEGALREVARQQGGIASGQIIDDAKSEGMLAAKPFMGALSQQPTGPRIVRTPNEIAKLPSAELLAIYCRVMREVEDVFVKYESYIVRQWDGMDGCWTDCTSNVSRDEALRYWAEKTDGGTHHIAYAEIDYYRIFPAGARMLWDGSEGGEMHR